MTPHHAPRTTFTAVAVPLRPVHRSQPLRGGRPAYSSGWGRVSRYNHSVSAPGGRGGASGAEGGAVPAPAGPGETPLGFVYSAASGSGW